MNGENFILWTTEEAGYFKATRGTREQYDEAVRSGYLKLKGLFGTETIPVYFVAFGPIEANHDFGLGQSRDAA